MKVLLISIKNNGNLPPVIPIGMLYIAEALRLHNYEFKMIDLNFHRRTYIPKYEFSQYID